MKSGVYQILNKINGKSYVGSAVDLKSRFSCHKSDLHNNRHHNTHLQNAWKKYGEDTFQFYILEYVEDTKLLVETEQRWIDSLKTSDRDFGYNARKVASSNLGLKLTDEHKRKIAETNKRRVVSEETRKKMSVAKMGNKNLLGKKHSEETKKRIGDAGKGKKRGPILLVFYLGWRSKIRDCDKT